MEKTCGRCSIDSKMELEKRKELALTVVPEEVYQCSICKRNWKKSKHGIVYIEDEENNA